MAVPSKRTPIRNVATGATTTTTTPSTTINSQQPRKSPSYYLLKSEPHEFSIDQLEQCPDMTSEWDGIRNFQARNVLRSMQVNDLAWFYYSSCKEPGIVGKVRITRTVKPDATALEPTHKYYDAKSTVEKCRWDSVQIRLERRYPVPLMLSELRAQAAAAAAATAATTNSDGSDNMNAESDRSIPSIIAGMKLLQTTRLSVQPVTPEEWKAVEDLISRKEKGEALLATTGGDSVDNELDVKTHKKNENPNKRTKKRANTVKATSTNDSADDSLQVEDDVTEKKVEAKKQEGKRRSKRTRTKEE